MKCHPSYALLLLSLLSLVGCASSDSMAKADKLAAQEVVFSTTDVASSVAVGTISRNFDGGLLQVAVPLRATSDLDLTVDYQITFFDENHTPVDSPTAWQTKSLPAGQMVTVMASSSSPRAKDFKMELRWNRQ